jgi:signal transduction histidine kinase
MNTIDVIRITALTATVFNVVLTLLVLGREFRSTLHRVYMLWGLSITLWNFGIFHLSQQYLSHEDAMFWATALQLGVILTPISLFHLSLVISKTRVGWVLPALYLADACFVAGLFSHWFIIDVRKLDVGYWSVPGPGFTIFTVFYLMLTTSLVVILYRKQKGASPTQRTRLRALLLALLVLWVFGSNDMMPIWGFDHYPFTHLKFYPLGSLGAIIYAVVVGYSVLQHQLLDIHVTMSRLAAQFVRLLFMVLVGFSLLLLLSWLAPKSFSTFSFVASIGVLAVSALVASFFFPQFFGKGSDALERQILGDRFEYHARVQNLIQTMKSFPEPELLLEELDALLASTMKVRSYQVILLDDAMRGFTLWHSHPARTAIDLSDLTIDSPIFRYFQQTRAKFLSCNLLYESEWESLMQRDARQQLKAFEPEFCFPFFAGNELVGLMLLGSKENGDLFTPHDLRLLTELSSNLGLVLNQIRLRRQLQGVYEQDLMGRMSRGLAHDLNNLLTPVQTLLQLLQESRLNQETIDELLPMGLRNLETVRTYVNEALFFSQSSQLQARPESLDETVRDAMSLVRANAEAKDVAISFKGESGVVVEMDAVLIKRLVSNLLSNAVDASPRGAQVVIQLAALPKTELSRDWYRLKIVDHGEGISPENLRRVFTPYFTTKNTGDGKRGFGLGLAIARNIVQLHGGNLSIYSMEKKGTTVQVDLPSKLNPAQNQPAAAAGQRRRMVPA